MGLCCQGFHSRTTGCIHLENEFVDTGDINGIELRSGLLAQED